MKFKDFHNDKKPREKAIKYGIENLNDEELLAIILRTGTKENNVLNLSREIFNSFKSIDYFSI